MYAPEKELFKDLRCALGRAPVTDAFEFYFYVDGPALRARPCYYADSNGLRPCAGNVGSTIASQLLLSNCAARSALVMTY